MTASRSNGLTALRLALATSALGFGVLAGLVLVNPVDVTPIPPAARPPAAAAAAGQSRDPPAPLPSIEQLSETRDRPLFSPTRKPIGTSAGTIDGPAGGASDIELLGTIGMDGSERALLRVKQPASQQWLAVGAVAAGWRVASIAKDRVVIVAGGQSRELVLYPGIAPK